MKIHTLIFTSILLITITIDFKAQNTNDGISEILAGMEFREIGPAKMAGRIADIAIHPDDENVWYVAVGSGGVWKTVNAGVTWKSIFDGQSSYSVGCVTIDDNNPHTIWVGSGENVGGRHVGYGDGIYKSEDGGQTWKNLGLRQSEHISKILIHPDNSDIIWVASQGPLWKSGGQRGIYKTTNGGETWKRTLGDDQWVGATDLIIDPRNPNRLYAATWQRHRTVAAYLGGGPGTALYRSEDSGESWIKLDKGLPKGNMGKIGLAISPQKPDEIYAAIELDHRTGGVYKSFDRGASWVKQSDAVSGATGPHYYQELYACPHTYDRIYLVDVRMQISNDGGKTFQRMAEKHKHSDNHAIAFRSDDPDYLLVGTDGGLYESFDLAENWRFMANMPITQFYKIAVDDAEPFYNVYGGTQDNSTQGGPSRTDNVQGIQNSDWKIVLNWDGHQPATEPGNPNIMYGQRQEGTLSRIDLSTGEVIDIQPQPGEGEPYERYNWDAPIRVSPFDPATIYFASQRLWKSTDRGDSWTTLSNDLTRNEERITLPIMGRSQSWNNAWDLNAMSNYNTITSIAESPLAKGLIYIGTDDGIIQVTEDGGANWRKIELSSIQGIPAMSYVNNIEADIFDANTVYVALDNHKYGDYKPYLIKSTDRGRTWKSIAANLPDRHLVWRVVQDHVASDLLFVATEFGIFVTVDGGEKWHQMKGGLPTISFRDIKIQRRENDLVAGSFGRSIYILDDYTALREVNKSTLSESGKLFPIRDAWWYIPRSDLGFDGMKGDQGAGHYVAPNPDFGALVTFYLKDNYKTSKELRLEKEKIIKSNESIPFPGWDKVEAEKIEQKAQTLVLIKDEGGQVIRKIYQPAKKGIHRLAWDLRFPNQEPLKLEKDSPVLFPEESKGRLVTPGIYQAELYIQQNGILKMLDGPVSFEVKRFSEGVLPSAGNERLTDFWSAYDEASRDFAKASITLEKLGKKIIKLQEALEKSTTGDSTLTSKLHELRSNFYDTNYMAFGYKSKSQPGEKNDPTIGERLFVVSRVINNSTYGPTQTSMKVLQIIKSDLGKLDKKIMNLENAIRDYQKKLLEVGAPWIE